MISCFDTVKEEIIQLDQPKLKEPVYSTAAVALDGKIYIFGGSNGKGFTNGSVFF